MHSVTSDEPALYVEVPTGHSSHSDLDVDGWKVPTLQCEQGCVPFRPYVPMGHAYAVAASTHTRPLPT